MRPKGTWMPCRLSYRFAYEKEIHTKPFTFLEDIEEFIDDTNMEKRIQEWIVYQRDYMTGDIKIIKQHKWPKLAKLT